MYLFNRNKGVDQSLHLTDRGKHLFLLSYLTVVILKAHPFSAERVEASERDLTDVSVQEQLSETPVLESETLSFHTDETDHAMTPSTLQPAPVFEPVTTLSDEELLEQPAIYTTAVAATSAATPAVTIPISDLMTTNFELKDETIYWKHEFNPGFVNRDEMNWFFNVPISVSAPTNWEISQYDTQGQLVERLTDWGNATETAGISYETVDFISRPITTPKELKILHMIEGVDFKGYRQVLESSQNLHYLLKVNNHKAASNRWVVTYQTKVIDKERTPDYLVGLASTDHDDPKQLQRILVDYGKSLFPDLKKPEQPKIWPVYAGDHSISGRTNPYFLVTVDTANETYMAKSDSSGHFRVGIPKAQANAAFTVQVANVLGIHSDPLTLTVGVPTGTTPAIQTTSDSPGGKVLTAKMIAADLSSYQERSTTTSYAATSVSQAAPIRTEMETVALSEQPVTIGSVINQVKSFFKELAGPLSSPIQKESTDAPLTIDAKGKITIKPVSQAHQMTVTYQTKSGKKKRVTIRQNAKGLWMSSDDQLVVDKKTGQITLLSADLSARTNLSVEMTDKANHSVKTESIEIPNLPSSPKLLPYKGDVLVLPPEEAVELLLSYKDMTGYTHVIEAYKNSQTGNWESRSNDIFLSSGISLIIIPNRSLGEDVEVVVSTRNAAGFYSEETSERTSAILAKSESETEKQLEQHLK